MSTQTLLPNSFSSATSAYTVTGAASVNAALADTSDSSYVKRAAAQYAQNTSWLVLPCSNYTIPAGSIVRRVRAAVKILVPSGGAAGVGLGDGELLRFKSFKTIAPQSNAWVYGPWETTPAGGGSWTQARLDAAAVNFRDFAWDGSGYVSTLYEAKLEVEVIGQPTISVTAPTGTQSTPTPTCTWSYTGTDGYQQAVYQVRVFDSATYGGGGFDAETSTALWETLSYGQATSISLGPLPPAPTLRAYVRVQASSGLWSAWGYSGFTYSVDGAAQPSLSLAWNTATQAVDVSVLGRVNLLDANTASMETTVGTWVADNTGTTTVLSGPARDNAVGGEVGSWAAFMSSNGAGTCRAKSGSLGSASAGNVKSVRAALRTVTGSHSARIGIRWLGPGTITWSTAVTAGTAWGTIASVNSAVAPSGTTGWEIVIEFTATAGSQILLWDAVAAHQGGPATWSAGGQDVSSQTYVLERLGPFETEYTQVASGPLAGLQIATLSDDTTPRSDLFESRYRATGYITVSGYAVPSTTDLSFTVAVPPDGQVWFKGTVDVPRPRIIRTLDNDAEREQGLFVPVPDGDGRAYPIVVEGDLGARKGRWLMRAIGLDEALAYDYLMRGTEPLLFQDPYGDQFWFRITGHSRSATGPADDVIVDYDVSWVEVA